MSMRNGSEIENEGDGETSAGGGLDVSHSSSRLNNSLIARTFPSGRLAHPGSQNEDKKWGKLEEK